MTRALERVEPLLPPALFLGGFGAYLSCLGPWSGWLDSGELLAAASSLGVSHPPGQPLHALLAKAGSFWPAGGIALRGALLSAVAAAASWPLLYSLALALARAASPGSRFRDPWAPLLAAATAIAFGLLAPVCTEATRAEVYALTLALLLGVLRALLAWGAARDARCLALALFALGLSAGANPLLAGVVLVCAMAYGAVAGGRELARRGGLAICALVAGASVFLVLPVRAAAGADLAWGDPRTWTAFVSTATGAPYVATFAAPGQPLWDRLAGHLALVGRHVGWEMGVLALVGLGLLCRRSWRTGALVVGAAAAALGTAVAQRVFYPDNPDVSGYLLLTLGVLFAGASLPIAIEGPRLPPRAEGIVAVVGAAAVLVASPIGLRRADGHAETLVRAALDATPPRALLVGESDHLVFPLLYAQRVEGERPDVAVAIGPLLTSSWYLETLKRWQPGLFVPWVDDGRVGDLRARLVRENARERPVLDESPHAPGRDVGFVRMRGGQGDALAAWARWLSIERPGDLTRRVLGFYLLRRSAALARAGRLGEASQAALAALGERAPGLPRWETLVRARRAPLPARPSLQPVAEHVLRFSSTFVHADAEAAWRAGDLLWALGLSGPARLWLERSGTPEAALVRAIHAARAGDEAQAVAALARLGDRARDGRIAAAKALGSTGAREAALALVEPLVAERDAGALAIAGVFEAERGNSARAERLLRQSIETRPGAAEPLTNLGLLYAKQGRMTEAERAWAEAARLPGGHRARRLLRRLKSGRP